MLNCSTSGHSIFDLKLTAAITLLFIFCLAGCRSIKQVSVCNGFKNGRYVHYMYNNSSIGHWPKTTLNIEISDSFHIVTREYPFRDTQIFRVKWLGRCRYSLLFINPTTYLDSAFLRLSPKGKTYRIKKLSPDYILIKSQNQLDTIWKIH